jgi:tellurite resistance protein TerC
MCQWAGTGCRPFCAVAHKPLDAYLPHRPHASIGYARVMFLTSLVEGDAKEWLLLAFGVLIVLFLVIDLGFLNRKAHKVSFKSALYQSIFWVAVSVLFGLVIGYFYDPPGDKTATEASLEFFAGYLTEKALSVDNIFVIILILRYFQIEEKYYHKILFWGILGAILMRGVFIYLGVALIEQFHFILYIFGAFLIYSGISMMADKSGDDEAFNPEENLVMRLCRKYLRFTTDHNGKFFYRIEGKLFFTPLFMVLMLIESTDLIFAVDSIPAIFAITRDDFILYTSNIFAVLGLRAMFFMLAGMLDRFHYLQQGLSLVLVFIGLKMLLDIFDHYAYFHQFDFLKYLTLPHWLSLVIVLGILLGSIGLSILKRGINSPAEQTIERHPESSEPANPPHSKQ